MGYTPTTQGGAAPSTNAMSSAASDFNVVTDPYGTQHPFAHEPVSSDRNYRDPKTTPASDMLRNLIGLGQDQMLQMQQQLVAAGYLSKNAVTGVADADTRKAYAELLQDTSSYNSTGQYLTPDDVLGRRITSRAAAGLATGTGADPLNYQTDVHVYTPTDPARIRLTAEAAFKEALGRKPKPAELAKFTASFAAQEQHAQQVGFDAQDETRGAYIGRQLANSNAVSGQSATSITPLGESGASTRDARVAAMAAEAPGKITVTSGTRSHERQQQLWDAALKKYGSAEVARKWVAPPGSSQHEKGNADDLHFSDAKTREWAHANAARFGLVFPLANESWHVEVAGARGGVHAASAVAPQPVAGPAGAPAPVSTSVTVNQPDAGAQAIEFARAQNPVETQAYDVGQQFQNFLSILGKPVV